jgi:ABC-2 type transport system permease protein
MMKLRTLSSEFTLFRKDITRYFPVWGLYSVFLLLVLMVLWGTGDGTKTSELCSFALWLNVISPVYALVTALSLFGDLFSSRMCNALHALPLRRESLFAIHGLAGLCFSVVPNFLFALVLAPFCRASNWLWLGQSILEFVFFYGLALLCVQLTGSRFAAAVVYGLLNFGAVLLYWLLDTLYVPLLHGVVLDVQFFSWLCPVMEYFSTPAFTFRYGDYPEPGMILHSPEGWTYLGITAGVGLVLGGIALFAYRRRHLETAGDFMSVNWLKPVFLVAYSLVMAALFHFFFGLFVAEDLGLFMLLGMTVGYFTGQMFLLRTTRVFGKKSLLGFGALVAALLLSLGITALDPVGLTRWVPESEHVKSVYLECNYRGGELRDPALLEQVERFHREAMSAEETPASGRTFTVKLTYTLKNGRTAQREYHIHRDSHAGFALRPLASSPELVLGELYTNWEELWQKVTIQVDGEFHETVPHRYKQELMECLILDCRAGNLPQNWWDWNECQHMVNMNLVHNRDDYSTIWYSVDVTDRAEHTMAWLRDHGFSIGSEMD